MSDTLSSVAVIGMADVGLPGFVMSSVNGTDLVARTASEQGWWNFERPLPAVFLRCSQAWPGVMLDIGANTGFYSMLALTADPDNRSIAFEPDPRVLALLQRNVALNAYTDRITVHGVALSDTNGVLPLFVPLQGHGLVESSSSLQKDFKPEHSETVEVQVRRLEDFLPADQAISVVKIDVEGHEKSAMMGAEAVFNRARPVIAVELLDETDYGYFNGLIQRMNYRAVALRENCGVIEREMRFDRQAWNHILAPEEKWEQFAQIMADLGLDLVAQEEA